MLRRGGDGPARAAAIAVVALIPVAGAALFVGLHQAERSELRDQLAAQVTDILEKSTPAEHHEHGHEFGEQARAGSFARSTRSASTRPTRPRWPR